MRRSTLRPPLALACVLACGTFSPGARAQSDADRESAQTLFAQGNDARKAGDLQGAVAKYKVAYALVETPVIGLALGRAEIDLGQLVEGRQALLSVERIPPLPHESARSISARADAQSLAAEVAPRIPTVTLRLAIPAGAPPPIVTIDGAAIPALALDAPRRLDPGHHVAHASASAGAATTEASFDLAPGETREVPLPYPSEVPLTTPAPPLPVNANANAGPPASASSHSRAPAYVAFAAGGAGVVVTTVFGILAESKKSTLSSECGASPTTCPSGDVSALKTNALVSDIGLGVAIAGVGVGGLLLFLGRNDGAPAPGTAQISPWLGLGAAGLRGRF